MRNDCQSPAEAMVPVNGNRWVPGALWDAVRRDVEAALPRLQHGVHYLAEHLVSHDLWASLDAAGRRTAGRCLAHLVCTGAVPLKFASCKHCTTKRYELR